MTHLRIAFWVLLLGIILIIYAGQCIR